MKALVACALLVACGKSDTQGLPPASDWNPGAARPAVPATPPANAIATGSDSPANPMATAGSDWHPSHLARGSAAPPPLTPAEAASAFIACFGREIAKAPAEHAIAFELLARHAPPADARAIVLAIVKQADVLDAVPRAKVLGEAAWALVDAGDVTDAHAIATRCAALPQDGGGGRLTCLAVLGRIGALDEAKRAATDMMQRDVVAFGAAIGRHVDAARAIVNAITKDPMAGPYLTSAIHLKTLAAVGVNDSIEYLLAHSTNVVLDAGAVVEGGAHRPPGATSDKIMGIGIAAIAGARSVAPAMIAQALIGAAGTAAAGRSKVAVADAIERFDALPRSARVGLELAPVSVYVTLGDIAEARKRFGAGGDPIDRAMFTADLAAASGTWSDMPDRVPPNATLIADVWGRALAAKLDAATRARVLAVICGP